MKTTNVTKENFIELSQNSEMHPAVLEFIKKSDIDQDLYYKLINHRYNDYHQNVGFFKLLEDNLTEEKIIHILKVLLNWGAEERDMTLYNGCSYSGWEGTYYKSAALFNKAFDNVNPEMSKEEKDKYVRITNLLSSGTRSDYQLYTKATFKIFKGLFIVDDKLTDDLNFNWTNWRNCCVCDRSLPMKCNLIVPVLEFLEYIMSLKGLKVRDAKGIIDVIKEISYISYCEGAMPLYDITYKGEKTDHRTLCRSLSQKFKGILDNVSVQ